MATFLFLVQLLFIGTLISPEYAQGEGCDLPLNATASNFSVLVTPAAYRANTTYLVTVNDNRNLTDGKNVTKYLLQALSPQNVSTGQWKVTSRDNCSSAILNATQTSAKWTSPANNLSSVKIRAYILFSDKSAQFSTVTLTEGSGSSTAPPTTTPNSVSMVQSSSFFLSLLQLPLLLLTSNLLS
ncbi:uncharacterized protein LOC129737532 [Falco cherrug]|uniref:uncharacterized protein LOC129737532 n=1 Tax=Falco cherrug TaxID=345164 RepID=UPI002478BF4E|nr:uncharacterized protein LOC129737532 [Falco cherrug]XP_055584649.1 uncharacterized protein LOC129737532 [Falco cherrug]